ncbi:unnamed protein product [Oikopleura dioica]|uniref:Uncharacterized protein n=1 Tax=Oikopleura dioica TaxID=34765 RepID=E4Y000_OIKDI|nr:unnamed protein product [Oikopleura dioica]
MGLFKKAMMTINSNYVFFMIMLLLLVQLTRFNFFSTSNDKFEKIPFDQLTYEKEKFVVPILIFGPNNQIQGFRESLFIAETLGRKLILPPFFEHYTSEHSRGILSADAMLDISLLQNQFEVMLNIESKNFAMARSNYLWTFLNMITKIIEIKA